MTSVPLRAQDPVFDSEGVHGGRSYSSGFAGENIDTFSGNLSLTYVDVALSGNAGKGFRFGRVYNSKTRRWQVGPLDVVHTIDTPNGLVTAYSLQGGAQWLRVPWSDESITTGRRFWASESFAILDRKPDSQNRYRLYLPDGTINYYQVPPDPSDSRAHFLMSVDPFGNRLTRSFDETNKVETWQQWQGSAPFRAVAIQFDEPNPGLSDSLRPIRMTYVDDAGSPRVWHYNYNSNAMCCARMALIEAVPPAGTGEPWRYGYSADSSGYQDLTSITTPNGGVVRFEYDWYEFTRDKGSIPYDTCNPDNQDLCRVDSRVVTGRITEGREIASGTWEYEYKSTDISDATLARDMTEVSAADNTVSKFYYTALHSPALDFRLGKRIKSVNGNDVESETTTYQFLRTTPLLDPLPTSPESRSLEVATVTLTRNGGNATYSTSYTYDDESQGTADYHRPTTITESGNPGTTRTTTLSYDYSGYNLVPGGGALIAGKILTQSVRVGNGETFSQQWEHNKQTGFVTTHTVNGITTTYAPDALGNVRTIMRGNGTATTIAYAYGVPQQVTTPGVVTTREINPDGTVKSEETGPTRTDYAYDDLGRVTSVSRSATETVTTEYHADHIVVRQGQSETTTDLDGFGRGIRTFGPGGVNTATSYDASGRTSFASMPFYGSPSSPPGTDFAYDALGRVTLARVRGAAGNGVITSYGTGTVAITDEANRTTTQHWAAFGSPDAARLVGVTDANNQYWGYEYNTLGSLTKVTAPDGVVRTWEYFPVTGLLKREVHPESGETKDFAYDGAGLLKGKKDARLTQFTYDYDADNRLKKITAGPRVTTFTYKAGTNSRETAKVTVNGTDRVSTTYAYDDAGRIRRRVDTTTTKQYTQAFAYDGRGNLIELAYATGRVLSYSYDLANRVTRVLDVTPASTSSNNKEYASNFSYHPTGALASYTAGNGLVHTLDYDANRYWQQRIRTGTASNLSSLFDVSYAYDDVGNVLTMADARPGMSQHTIQYDNLDRLTRAVGPGFDACYSYDVHGNRVSNACGAYDVDPVTLRLRSAGSGPGIQVLGYDDNGNMISNSFGGAVYNYTPDNRLESSTVNGQTATYEYDADGWRIAKSSNSQVLHYMRGPNGELMSEVGGSTRRDYLYASGRLIGMVHNVKDGAEPLSHIVATHDAGTGVVHATFTASSPENVPLASATLLRAPVQGSCSVGSPAGCSWSATDSVLAPANVTAWSDSTSLTDTPPTGTFVYNVRVTDVDGAAGDDSTPVAITSVDDAPNTFSFTNQTGVAVNTQVLSNIVAISGISTSVPIAVSGAGSYRVCTNATCSGAPGFGVTAGTIANGQWAQLRVTSSSAGSTAVNATLTVGSGSAVWTVTTGSAPPPDTTPNGFTFTDQSDVPTSSVRTSNRVQILGINAPAPTSITGGSYRVCPDSACTGNPPFASGPSTITNGQYLELRVTSSATANTTTTVTMAVGGVSDAWTVATQDTTPNPFTFNSTTGAPLNSFNYSACVQVTGITGNVPLSVSGTEIYAAVNNDPGCTTGPGWVANPTTPSSITNGQYIKLNIVSGNSYNQAYTGTITVGTYQTTWTVTTVNLQMTPDHAIRGCSNWWWHSPVYQGSATECLAYCVAQNADACEWHAPSGECYVEFGTGGCYVEPGWTDWHSAVIP